MQNDGHPRLHSMLFTCGARLLLLQNDGHPRLHDLLLDGHARSILLGNDGHPRLHGTNEQTKKAAVLGPHSGRKNGRRARAKTPARTRSFP